MDVSSLTFSLKEAGGGVLSLSSPMQSYRKWKVHGNEAHSGFIKGEALRRAQSFCIFFFFWSPPSQGPQSRTAGGRDMETLLLLFPQFSYATQKKEVYFRMLGASRAAAMKDDSGGLVLSRLIQRRL